MLGVGASAVVLAALRRRDAKGWSLRSAIAAATGGAVTGLAGGLPIRFDGKLLGGIGIGSGTGAQDVSVALAALAAIGAETF